MTACYKNVLINTNFLFRLCSKYFFWFWPHYKKFGVNNVCVMVSISLSFENSFFLGMVAMFRRPWNWKKRGNPSMPRQSIWVATIVLNCACRWYRLVLTNRLKNDQVWRNNVVNLFCYIFLRIISPTIHLG